MRELVRISSNALETEDQYIRNAIARNNTAYSNKTGGILRINNEYYYQLIIYRALIERFPYVAKIEVEKHDLSLYYPDNASKRFATVEMKRWMSPQGNSEIPGIKKILRS